MLMVKKRSESDADGENISDSCADGEKRSESNADGEKEALVRC